MCYLQEILKLRRILGYWPRKISLYRQALTHVKNERLEFLGDAVLDAVVGDVVYRHFPRRREGFLTNTRSKLVKREMLGRLADGMGITAMVEAPRISGSHRPHNSFMGGNTFEALVGALYLDRGYDACRSFWEKKVMNHINLDKLAFEEMNFKSKLLEWSQKHRVEIDFPVEEIREEGQVSPLFVAQALVGGEVMGEGSGYSKKESQQNAAKMALKTIRKRNYEHHQSSQAVV